MNVVEPELEKMNSEEEGRREKGGKRKLRGIYTLGRRE